MSRRIDAVTKLDAASTVRQARAQLMSELPLLADLLVQPGSHASTSQSQSPAYAGAEAGRVALRIARSLCEPLKPQQNKVAMSACMDPACVPTT